MRRWHRGTLVGIALATASACGSEPTGLGLTGVEVRRVQGGVELTNGTNEPLAYAAYNPNWLGLLALCADPGPTCLRLRPHARIVVPESEFLGWEGVSAEQQKLRVRWWRVVPAPGDGWWASDVQEVAVIE